MSKDASDRLRVMEVARLLKCRYQKARDLMLTGKLGDPEHDTDGKMTVAKEKVLEFDRARRARA
jgi:hypothetical protein